jgi:hypothetical protein
MRHRQAEKWALQHGSQFSPEKYELVHFSRDPTGHTSKNTDIAYDDDGAGTMEDARFQHVVYSTRLKMDRLLRGETIFNSQFPEVTGAEMHIDDIGVAVGHLEVLV